MFAWSFNTLDVKVQPFTKLSNPSTLPSFNTLDVKVQRPRGSPRRSGLLKVSIH